MRRHIIWILLLTGSIAGCATPPGYTRIEPTAIDMAVAEIPEDQLLDVGVALTATPELSRKELEKQGTHQDIRRSERVYVPFHLKNTMQSSSHWGAVRVIPPAGESVDLKVTSELVESNGEEMRFVVEAVDATGRRWLREKYQIIVTEDDYYNTSPGHHEAFQDLYNTIANELATFKRSLTPADLEQIRTVATLKFAEEFAPDAFDDYLTEDEDGAYVITRLPTDDDPFMERIAMVRERDEMFVDTLNQYYEGFYVNMWEAYENWRKFNLAEQVALRQMEHDAMMRTLAGVMMVAAAVALEVGDVPNSSAASGALILTGGQVVVSGINLSQQASIHAEAIRELSESFGSEMRTTVVELEGKQYELTGTASEQYRAWKNLLRRIYFEQTGFGPEPTAEIAADDSGAASGQIEQVDP